jgi:hypothetical protein
MNRNRKQIGRVTMCFRSDGEVDQHRHRIPISRSLSSLWESSLWKNLSREPRNNTLRESFKITDGITLLMSSKNARTSLFVKAP